MKTLIFTFIALLSSSSWAHVEPGTYHGTAENGASCSMTAGETYFENQVPHPLNERIQMTIENDIFLVGHPSIVKPEESLAYFNHDVFQGVLPTKTGAKALIIHMVHSEEFEGPASYELIDHAWKSDSRKHLICKNLKLQKP